MNGHRTRGVHFLWLQVGEIFQNPAALRPVISGKRKKYDLFIGIQLLITSAQCINDLINRKAVGLLNGSDQCLQFHSMTFLSLYYSIDVYYLKVNRKFASMVNYSR